MGRNIGQKVQKMQENYVNYAFYFVLTCTRALCTLWLMKSSFDLSVYVIIDPAVCNGRSVGDVAAAAMRGGARMVQLRNKTDSIALVKEQALIIQKVLADSSVTFIMNDHVELAAEINVDGVHIGQGDMSAAQAREIIGKDKILGLTAFTRTHYDVVDSSIIDYVGTGPFYATLTKPDKAVLGAEGFAVLAKDSPVPVVGIGGITSDNAAAVIKAGADGVAMMRAVTAADNVEHAVRDFVTAVEGARHEHSQCA